MMPRHTAPASLKSRLKAGEQVFGAWVGMGAATPTEILAMAGFDFLIVDLEHGQLGAGLGLETIRAVQSTDAACIVRVPSADPIFLKRILDAGVDGVMVPSVETPEAARAAVAACKYPPQGIRGYAAPNVRASRYGVDTDYFSRANDEILIVLQIESASAVEHTREICNVDGVDVVFIGVNDLGGTIGRLEQLDQPDVRALVERAEKDILACGKVMGTVPSAGASWRDLLAQGYNFLPLASDVALLREAAQSVVRDVSTALQRGK